MLSLIVKQRNLQVLNVLAFLVLLFSAEAFGQNVLQPPKGLKIVDTPYDNGTGICLIWEVSPSDAKGVNYLVYSSSSENGPFEEIKLIPSTAILPLLSTYGLSHSGNANSSRRLPSEVL